MNNVKITFKDGRSVIIPEANLSNTMRIMESSIENVENEFDEPEYTIPEPIEAVVDLEGEVKLVNKGGRPKKK